MKASKPVIIGVQLGAAWAVGALALPTMWFTLLISAFAGRMGLFGVVPSSARWPS